jgi:hypothetical protein
MISPSGITIKPVFVLSIPLCALVLGLGGCAYSPGPVDWIAEGESSFIVTCAPSACAQRATAICNAQGFSRYDILERRQGDDLGEGGGIVIQCNGERPAPSPSDVGLYRLH